MKAQNNYISQPLNKPKQNEINEIVTLRGVSVQKCQVSEFFKYCTGLQSNEIGNSFWGWLTATRFNIPHSYNPFRLCNLPNNYLKLPPK